MADPTRFTNPLNFNDGLIGKSINDRSNGVDVIFGYVSGLAGDDYDFLQYNKGVGIALMDRGMGSAQLDRACQQLSEECRIEKCDILITKSDLPFDSRWYLIGDIEEMINLADKDRITLPFSKSINDSVIREL